MSKQTLLSIAALICGIASFIWLPNILLAVGVILLAVLELSKTP